MISSSPRQTARRWLESPRALLRDPVVVYALAIALVSRIALAGVMWLSLRAIPRLPLYPAQYDDNFFPDHPSLDGWARWDTAHYVNLALHGYGSDNPSPHGGLGFFPLYSLLMRGLVEVTGAAATPANLALAGLVVANICFFVAVAFLARLAADHFGAEAGKNAALLLCVAPLSFFFNAAYTESLFLVLSLASLTAASRGRWWWAAAIAGIVTGTRLVGLALPAALLFFAWRRRTSFRDLIAICLISPLGIAAFFAYTWLAHDNLFAYFDAQSTWGGWDEHVRFYADLFLTRPNEALRGDPRHLIIIFNVALAALYLAFVPAIWRRLNPGIALFSILLIVIQTAFTWVSLGRYLLPAVGLYLVVGLLLTQTRYPPWVRDAVVIASTILMAALAVLYGHGFWVV
ncbi:MAG: mannosyltransferase family protein [Thermomicrobiales bacterium]